MKSSIIRTVAEGTFFTSTGTLVIKVVGLLTVFSILRTFGAGQYGVLELTLSITALFSIFMLPGLDSVVVADSGVYKGKGELSSARQLLKAYFVLQVVLALVAAVAVLLGAGFLSTFYQVPKQYVMLLSLLFLLSPLQLTSMALLRLHLRFFQQSLLNFVQEVLKLVFLLFFVLVIGYDISSVIMAMILSQAFGLLMLTPSLVGLWRSLIGGGDGKMVAWWSFLWGHSAWGILSSYVGNLGRAIRLWIIQFLLGPEAVGLYAVAAGLMGHTTGLAPLSTVLTPMLPQHIGDRNRFRRLLTKGMQYQLYANIVVGAIAFFLVPPVISRIFPEYVSSLPLYQIMLLALIPGAVVSIVTPVFSALRLQRSFFFAMVLKTIFTAIFTYGGIVLFGIWGVAYEAVLTAMLQAFERTRSIRKKAPELSFSRESFFSFADDQLILSAVRGKLVRTAPFLASVLGK